MKLIRCLFALCLLAAMPAFAAAPGKLVFAAVPQFTAPQVFKEWQPLLKRLAADTGLEFEIRTYDNIPKFESAFLHGEVDLAYMNPWHAVMARRALNYVPLVRDAQPLKGILLVRENGPAKLADLDGKTLGFPAPNAFGASLYMRALLAEAHGVRIVPRYLETHSNVYRHVLFGEVAAGGSVRAAFESEPPALRQRLRVLYETPDAAPHPLAAHPRVPPEVRERLAQALLALRATPEGRTLLKTVRMPGIMAADYDRDYRPLERLKLDQYMAMEHQ